MLKILIAEFQHESNNFSNQLTDLAAYQGRLYLESQAMIDVLTGTSTEAGGALQVFNEKDDLLLLPVVAASAMPSGPVTSAVFKQVRDMILAELKASAPVDGVLLFLHGAMITQDSEDGDGDLLEAVRQLVGPAVPVIATLDLHANITKKMALNATALINYDKYPHTDMYERGQEAARLLLASLAGTIKPVMACSHIPIILPPMATAEPLMQKIYVRIFEYEKAAGVLTVSLAHGFQSADIYELGMTVVAVTDQDQALAEKIARELADYIWGLRRELKPDYLGVEDSVKAALAAKEGPVILADQSDNPGGGSSCDGTHILRAMLENEVKDAAVALIIDPAAVAACHAAGVGAKLQLSLGGKARPDLLGAPLECTAYVRLLSDGRYINRGQINGGIQVDLHKSAVIQIGGIQVIIASNVTQPYDLEIFYAHGIDPVQQKILLVKSTIHFRAAFAPIASQIINVAAPGLLIMDPAQVDYQRSRRPIYPLDDI